MNHNAPNNKEGGPDPAEDPERQHLRTYNLYHSQRLQEMEACFQRHITIRQRYPGSFRVRESPPPPTEPPPRRALFAPPPSHAQSARPPQKDPVALQRHPAMSNAPGVRPEHVEAVGRDVLRGVQNIYNVSFAQRSRESLNLNTNLAPAAPRPPLLPSPDLRPGNPMFDRRRRRESPPLAPSMSQRQLVGLKGLVKMMGEDTPMEGQEEEGQGGETEHSGASTIDEKMDIDEVQDELTPRRRG